MYFNLGGYLWRLVLKYSKEKELKFISHLELTETLKRALRRAFFILEGKDLRKRSSFIPAVLTSGFTPKLKVSWGPPLPIGVESEAEYFEVYLRKKIPLKEFVSSLNRVLPEGVFIKEAAYVSLRLPSISVLAEAASYEIRAYILGVLPSLEEVKEKFWQKISTGAKEGKKLETLIKENLFSYSLDFSSDVLIFSSVILLKTGSLRPLEVFTFMLNSYSNKLSYEIISIWRRNLFKVEDGKLIELMDFVCGEKKWKKDLR